MSVQRGCLFGEEGWVRWTASRMSERLLRKTLDPFVSLALVPADQATYIYDDLGRLSQVMDGQGNVATYRYDAVGNLLSIARNTGEGTYV